MPAESRPEGAIKEKWKFLKLSMVSPEFVKALSTYRPGAALPAKAVGLRLLLTGSTCGHTLLRGYFYVHFRYNPDICSPALLQTLSMGFR